MPETVPVTPEQRAHAAEKYGLRVEDYKPFPDNGFPLGDYPDLPPVSQNSRSPYEDWDIPEVKRNYKEPVSTILFSKFLSISFIFFVNLMGSKLDQQPCSDFFHEVFFVKPC